MRTAFVNKILEKVEKDKDVFLITGDLGYSVFEAFKKKFPANYINAGTAEQMMAGVAAGLAMTGRKVILYSIIPFTTFRCLEQIKNDICYQNANVKIVGVGAGFSYGASSMTHFALEDIAVMRALPNMTVLSPGDPFEAERSLEACLENDGPFYIRIGKKGEPVLHAPGTPFRVGKGIVIKPGKDVSLIATGNMLENSLLAARLLEKDGISAEVISMHTLKPIDCELIENRAGNSPWIFTIEEHSTIGGLGSAVAEVLASCPDPFARFERFGVDQAYTEYVGSQEYLRRKFALTADGLHERIIKCMAGKS